MAEGEIKPFSSACVRQRTINIWTTASFTWLWSCWMHFLNGIT